MQEFIQESFIKKSANEKTPELPPRYDDVLAEQRINKLDIDRVTQKIQFFSAQEAEKIFRVLARLVIELEDEIPRYDTLFSDDASGRLITLFLREVINKKRKALGEKSVQAYFLAGGRWRPNQEAVKEFIRRKKSSVKKALLVTEFISSGESINRLVEILEGEHLDFDVASASIAYDLSIFTELGGLIRRLRYGEIGLMGMRFYNKSFTGVRKDMPMDSVHPAIDPDANRDKMRRVRQDMKLMAAEISKLIMDEEQK